MTGFGRCDDQAEGSRLVCELRTVNHRYLSIKWRAPSHLVRFQPWIEAELRKKLVRGSVEVSLQLRSSSLEACAELDEKAADEYRRRVERYLRSRKLSTQVSPEFLLQLPGVFVAADPADLVGTLRPRLQRAVRHALQELVEMRTREGERLKKAIQRELKAVERSIRKIRVRVPRMVEEYRRRLAERIATLLEGSAVELDEQTLAREVAIFADRSDVTEEIDRLGSHLEETRGVLEKDGAIGRSLDFLVQEFSREVHTIGSKTQDARALESVLAAKASVERIREQVQNLE
jgi:uncharacterized protein (TIGR00255 family)